MYTRKHFISPLTKKIQLDKTWENLYINKYQKTPKLKAYIVSLHQEQFISRIKKSEEILSFKLYTFST